MSAARAWLPQRAAQAWLPPAAEPAWPAQDAVQASLRPDGLQAVLLGDEEPASHPDAVQERLSPDAAQASFLLDGERASLLPRAAPARKQERLLPAEKITILQQQFLVGSSGVPQPICECRNPCRRCLGAGERQWQNGIRDEIQKCSHSSLNRRSFDFARDDKSIEVRENRVTFHQVCHHERSEGSAFAWSW